MRPVLALVAGSLLAALPAAQTRIEATGPLIEATLDLDTGVLTVGPSSSRIPTLCFDNSIDDDNWLDGLLYPAGQELYDWGVKACGGSRFVEAITVGIGSMAQPVSQGGPGGAITLRIYEGGTGNGSPGTLVRTIPLTGLPSVQGPLICPVLLRVNLGAQSFRLPDGPIGWSYENQDGLTAPLLVDVDPSTGTEDFLDLYIPPPATPASYASTFQLGPGGLSNDPKENSFYLKIFQNDVLATVTNVPLGANPDVLRSPEPPILGANWGLFFNLSQTPNLGVTMVAFSNSSLTNTFLPYGELYVNLLDQACPISVRATDTHRFQLPIIPAFAGRTIHLQGAFINGNGWPDLTNGLDVVIGTYMQQGPSDG
jgi:hypothetical protein